jgi:hypothetical protein
MNGNWAESEERLVKLLKDEPEIFAIYVNYVYTNNIATNSCEGSKAGDLIRHELLMLSKLYILCEKLCDKAGKNATVEAIIAVNTEVDSEGKHYAPGPAAISLLYTGTPEGSPVRQLVADLCTRVSAQAITNDLPKEFLVDLTISLLNSQDDKRPSIARRNSVGRYLEKMD